MRIAVQVLSGQKQPLHQLLPLQCYYTEGPVPKLPAGGTCEKIVIGKDAFPKDSPGLSLPASPPWTDIPISAVTP